MRLLQENRASLQPTTHVNDAIRRAGTLLNGTNGAEFDNANNKANDVGYSVAAGDINGDGIADVIIGAVNWPGGSPSPYKGAVYIVWGKTGAWSSSPTLLNAAFLNGTTGIELDDSFTNGCMGNALATGDVNGDGMADLIIGADQIPRSGYSTVGSIFVLFGGTTKHDGYSGPRKLDHRLSYSGGPGKG